MLEEFWYDAPPDADAVARARLQLDHCLAALLTCDPLWDEVRAAAPGRIAISDPFAHFALSMSAPHAPVRVYAAPDLIMGPRADGPYVITDLTTGSAAGVIDQLLTYAVTLRTRVRAGAPCHVIGQVIALGAPRVQVAVRVAHAVSASTSPYCCRRRHGTGPACASVPPGGRGHLRVSRFRPPFRYG